MSEEVACSLCGEARASTTMQSGLFLSDQLVAQIQKRHPEWQQEQLVCEACVRDSKAMVAQELLKEEMGALSPLEEEVIESIRADTFMTVNEFAEDEHPSWGQQVAHRITAMIGNWYFPLTIAILVVSWLVLNLLLRPFSPFPLIVLGVISAILASLAALQGPIIIISQRDQQRRDRIRADNEYRVNLKAEMEIRYLDEKVATMMKMQQQILREIQRGHPTPTFLGTKEGVVSKTKDANKP